MEKETKENSWRRKISLFPLGEEDREGKGEKYFKKEIIFFVEKKY